MNAIAKLVIVAGLLSVLGLAVASEEDLGPYSRADLFNDTEAPVHMSLTFEKWATAEGVWVGTVSGDINGRLVSTLISADQSNPISLVELVWVVVADDPSESFVLRTSGTLDKATGEVITRGSVVVGPSMGALAEEEGTLLDPDTSHYTGTIRLVLAKTGL